MRIAVSSGKGGTGKTTVATNLAVTAARAGRSVGYLDCDVEEPNGHLFLKPQIIETRPVNVEHSQGGPRQVQRLRPVRRDLPVQRHRCHEQSRCWCSPSSATAAAAAGWSARRGRSPSRTDRPAAWSSARPGDVHCVQGLLNIGEAMSPPVIAAVKEAAPDVDLLVIDSPPGTSCPVIESVRDSDFVLLVTEPTPFGLNDLKLAVEMVRALELPFAVVINRADVGDGETRRYCAAAANRRAGRDSRRPAGRRGLLARRDGVRRSPEYRKLYAELLLVPRDLPMPDRAHSDERWLMA